MGITQDKLWLNKWREVNYFVDQNKRRPSKHRKEDHAMLNWIKYNRRKYQHGLMKEDRRQKFEELEKKLESVTRINQYAYVNKQQQPQD